MVKRRKKVHYLFTNFRNDNEIYLIIKWYYTKYLLFNILKNKALLILILFNSVLNITMILV